MARFVMMVAKGAGDIPLRSVGVLSVEKTKGQKKSHSKAAFIFVLIIFFLFLNSIQTFSELGRVLKKIHIICRLFSSLQKKRKEGQLTGTLHSK
jgi:hypothetical protein